MKHPSRLLIAAVLSSTILLPCLSPRSSYAKSALGNPETLELLKNAIPPSSIHLQAVPEAPAVPAESPEDQLGLSLEDVNKLEQIATFIKNAYIDGDQLNSTKLFYGAVKGMARELDPHSVFFAPDDFKKFQEVLSGSLTGIGVALEIKKAGTPDRVLYDLPNSPAQKAGLKPGDLILKVDGADAVSMDQDELISKIKGVAGTAVTLTIGRADPITHKLKTFDVTITRAVVESANAYSKMLPNSVGYLYFTDFREETADTVVGQIRQLKAQGMTSLIIDIRDNPGGSLDAVAELTSVFLRKGQIVVSALNRRKQAAIYAAEKDGEFKDLPLKILVNGGSASASEIMSGALQDYKRAVIIGSETYGKGTAQSIIPFRDGSALKLTMMRWYTPKGHSIQRDEKTHKGGVTPDVPVPVSPEAEGAAIERIMRELNGEPLDPASVPDPALEKALQAN